ncbi:MAG: hypothetical protein JJ713_04730 [Acidithiobacillus sp.]|uniref:hypothetical protein n=1 Tax=Acidithiobacillus sp. TaxID=1872118 RepID=UPI002586C5BC|nr:hypothetical protein [Acidithiobacillus sp.]MCE5420078.1 hypothetical protein [Acidithiobacillus sp.]
MAVLSSNHPGTREERSLREDGAYPRWAKILHMGLVLAVTFELYNSLAALWFANFQWFPLHVATGIFLTFWLVLCWAFYLGTLWGRALLWSWFFPAHLPAIIRDLRALFLGRLPAAGPVPGLSSLWQGVFFLGVSFVTFTGFAAWLVLEGYISWPGATHLGLHAMRLGTPLLAYLWFGHVFMAFFHALRRQPLWGIFAFWRGA